MGQAELWFGAGPGRGKRRGGPGRIRGRRVAHLRRHYLPGGDLKRDRVGTHHDRGGRQALPVRIVRLPGGVCRRRGDPGPVRQAGGAGRGRRGVDARGARSRAPARRPRRAPCSTETAEYLGVGIGNLINLFNPERVILGGWAGLLLGGRLLPEIRESARRNSLRQPFAGGVDRARPARAGGGRARRGDAADRGLPQRRRPPAALLDGGRVPRHLTAPFLVGR